jgi:hypothetical protein
LGGGGHVVGQLFCYLHRPLACLTLDHPSGS